MSITTLTDKTVLVTGANRGIGRALVTEALRRGATHVYAATRRPIDAPDPRVTNLILDVTNVDQIHQVADRVASLDVLVNNAGLFQYDDLVDRAVIEQHLAVNLFGTLDVTHALVPKLAETRGAVVNVLSVAALAALPMTPAYSISKAAAFSMSQSLRAILSGQGITVHAALLGPVDTDMTRDLPVPKASPEAVAGAIFDGLAAAEEEIFPDPLSAPMATSWRDGAVKALERQNADLLGGMPAAAR